MQAVANTFDGIIDTVSAQHDISQLLPLLKVCSASSSPCIASWQQTGLPTSPLSFRTPGW